MRTFSKYELQDHVALEIARLYSNEYKEPFFVAVGYHSDYDIVSQSRNVRIELKVDGTTSRTGNVAIEYHNTSLRKVSGVLQTRANVWLHVVIEGNEFRCYEFDIDTLRKLVIEEGNVKDCATNARCKIIPLEVFRKSAKRSFTFQSQFIEEIKQQGGIVEHV